MRTVSIQDLLTAGLSAPEATRLAAGAEAAVRGVPADAAWSRVSREWLSPSHPHAVHRLLYDAIFADWPDARGPRPAWTPTPAEMRATNIHAALERRGLGTWAELHRWSVDDRAGFWEDVLETLGVVFSTRPERTLDVATGAAHARWLPGARLNIAETCLCDADDTPAVVYPHEGTRLTTLSRAELDAATNRFANALRARGAAPGTAVAIAMPMTVESVVAYLGTVKAGCVVVSIADSFAPDEIRARLEIAGAALAITQDVVARGGKILPMYEKVVAAGARTCVVTRLERARVPALRAGDVEWDAFLSTIDRFEPHLASPDDATNILFSSGTTGAPKAIPWSHSTPIKCMMDGYYHHDIRAGDVVAWPTNLGWMMGPWLIYASLANRAALALTAEAPNTREFCQFVADARVCMLGVVPSIVKAWRTQNLTGGLDWSALRAFSSTGEASNADDYLWLMARAGYKPVIEYCGGTEIGGGYLTQSLVQPASPAVFSTPSLGLDVAILDPDGRPAAHGELFVVPPSIGLSATLMNRDHDEVYYAGTPRGPHGEVLRRHGDQMEALPGGYFRAHGRADDTMNLGGIKVSSAEIERVVMTLEGVTDAAAIAVDPPGGGPSLLVLCLVLRSGASSDPDVLKRSAQDRIARTLNPLFRVHEVRVVDALPRTASNKVMRRVLRDSWKG